MPPAGLGLAAEERPRRWWRIVEDMGGVAVYIDDDSGYLEWLVEHPYGAVLNTTRNRSTGSSHTIHRARCSTISGTPAGGKRWTSDYIKACGTVSDVALFGRVFSGREPNTCQRCFP